MEEIRLLGKLPQHKVHRVNLTTTRNGEITKFSETGMDGPPDWRELFGQYVTERAAREQDHIIINLFTQTPYNKELPCLSIGWDAENRYYLLRFDQSLLIRGSSTTADNPQTLPIRDIVVRERPDRSQQGALEQGILELSVITRAYGIRIMYRPASLEKGDTVVSLVRDAEANLVFIPG